MSKQAKLHAQLMHAIKRGDTKAQARIIRQNKVRVVSGDVGIVVNRHGIVKREVHRLNERHKTCQDIRRFKSPKGPRDWNVLKGKNGVR